MKKLMLFALCIPMALLLTQFKTRPSNEYVIKATVKTGGNPARAYMSRLVDGEMVIDSVDIVNNIFEFKGIADEPFDAKLAINHTLEKSFNIRRTADAILIYVEPGIITLTSADSIKNATITGSPINDEAVVWTAKFDGLNKESEIFSTWYRGLTDEELVLEGTKAKINFRISEGNTCSLISGLHGAGHTGRKIRM